MLSLYASDNFNLTAPPMTLLIPSHPTVDALKPSPTKTPTPPAPPLPPVVAKVPGWTYRGCWTDYRSERTLISKVVKGAITPERCAHICKGYNFFGLEYSNLWVSLYHRLCGKIIAMLLD